MADLAGLSPQELLDIVSRGGIPTDEWLDEISRRLLRASEMEKVLDEIRALRLNPYCMTPSPEQEARRAYEAAQVKVILQRAALGERPAIELPGGSTVKFKHEPAPEMQGPSEQWIDQNYVQCDACQHQFIDLTAIKEGGKTHAIAGDPEGEGSGCAFCMNTDAEMQAKKPAPEMSREEADNGKRLRYLSELWDMDNRHDMITLSIRTGDHVGMIHAIDLALQSVARGEREQEKA